MFFGGALIVGGWEVVEWGRINLGPAAFVSSSSQDFSQSKFWHVVTTGYVYVLILWVIAVIALIFANKNHIVYRKKTLYTVCVNPYGFPYQQSHRKKGFFCCRLCENYWITYCTHVASHANKVDEIVDVMTSIKIFNSI